MVDSHHVRVIFWAGILERELLVPFRISEGVRMTSEKNVAFMTDHILPWCKKKNCAFHNNIIFMQHNGPSHAARNTSASFRAYLSILKRQIYEDRRHLASKKQLWEAVLTSCKDIQAEPPKLTSLMDAGIEKPLSVKLTWPVQMFLNSVNVTCILSFSFWKKKLFPLGDLFNILQIWFENYADHCLHRHFRKITENYHLHSNLKCSIYISYIKVFIFVVAL